MNNELISFLITVFGPYLIVPTILIIVYIVAGVVLYKRYKSSTYHKITQKSYLETVLDKGTSGEYHLYDTLRKLEADNRRFLFNVYVPKKDGETTEVDSVLICEQGVFVFESKNFAGWIFGDEKREYWTQTLPSRGRAVKKTFYNPVMQNCGHIKKLKEYLDLKEELPFYSVIVFTDKSEFKKVNVDPDNAIVAHHYNVMSKVEAKIEKSKAILSREKADEIYNKLYPLTQVTEAEKQAHIKAIEEKKNSNVCPRCGSPLVLRTAKSGANKGGQFYGCSSFPKCRYTKNI